MAEVGATRSTSKLVLVLGTGVLMIACGAGAYLVVRTPDTGGGFTPVGAVEQPSSSTSPEDGTVPATTPLDGATTVPTTAGFTLDTTMFSVVLPSAPDETALSGSFGSATVPATRWTVLLPAERLEVTAHDYSQVMAAGGADVQILFDTLVAAQSAGGASITANESITIGTDLARRATITLGGTTTYLTLVWRGSVLTSIAAYTPAAQPPAAYTAAVDSLVWKV